MRVLTMVLVCWCLVVHNAAIAGNENPAQWLQAKAEQLAGELNREKAKLDRSPAALLAFFESRALPLWDADRMARALLGSYWAEATSEQRQEMKGLWRETLLRYFLRAYPYYQGKLPEFDTEPNCPSKRRCWVRSHLSVHGHGLVDLDFLLLRHREKGWKVLDVRVAGVSLVAHKKGECLAVVRAKGITGLLQALADKNSQLKQIGQPAAAVHSMTRDE